jgi:hypothetical protein
VIPRPNAASEASSVDALYQALLTPGAHAERSVDLP